jgi:hypothetical protein
MAFDDSHFLLDKLADGQSDGHFLQVRNSLAVPTALLEVAKVWGKSLDALDQADAELAKDGGDRLPPYPHLLHISLITEMLLLSALSYLRRRGLTPLAIKYVRNCILAKTAEVINEEFPGVHCNFQLLVPTHLERPSVPEVPPAQDGDEGLHPRQG